MHRKFAKNAPLGWNSWDCFGAGVTEKQLRENADYMAEYLKEYGWEYIVCDIQWYEPKAKDNDYFNFTPVCLDEYGRVIPAENRFPSAAGGKGFKKIADYCHSLGLKFGIHIMRGIPRQAVHADMPIKDSKFTAREVAHHFSVCSWNTDMYGMKNCEGAQDYYNSIIKMYADWGVDFIKCDDICVTEFRQWDNPYSADYEIEMIRKAIDNCGREIVLSLSPGPAHIENADHLAKNANMWRMTGDFWDQWSKLYDMFDRCYLWQDKVKPGNYPDCDMLPLGRLSKNGTCHGPQDRMTQFTKPEQLTMMSLWGIFKSPLMMGGHMPDNDKWTLSLLTNDEYMKMHRTAYGAHQHLRNEENGQGDIIWVANGKGCKYVALFNTRDKEYAVKLDLTEILMPDEKYNIYDIWNKEKLGEFKNCFNAVIPPHGAGLYKVTVK
ncbi:MAG: glycoside hydrolase family 27 protein [Eubacterium sp.]|nr:glycoside hydrolase family 27 protein [Eubacterium sp.]MDE6767284.1 glycoside hydrolase family 27 protein [Eubacterium sp.]